MCLPIWAICANFADGKGLDTKLNRKKMRPEGVATRKRLLETALLLFTQKPYDKVTFKDIEKATGLSRGALTYHTPTKETLFREAVELFVFRNNTLTVLKDEDKTSLEKTIRSFVEVLRQEQENWRKVGVESINYALVNVQMSYYSLFKESLVAAEDWYLNECRIWREVIESAVKSGEIREVNPDKFAHIFEDTYLGAAYAGLPSPTGYSLDYVADELLEIYRLIKRP